MCVCACMWTVRYRNYYFFYLRISLSKLQTNNKLLNFTTDNANSTSITNSTSADTKNILYYKCTNRPESKLVVLDNYFY